jgi:hypothetical protein
LGRPSDSYTWRCSSYYHFPGDERISGLPRWEIYRYRGTGGDLSDGRFSFNVFGGRYHYIRFYDGQFNYPKKIFFQKGEQKIIYVEPGQMV